MPSTVITDTTSGSGEYWQWRDQSIHYVHAGTPQAQRPALLLVHGFGASTDHWRKNISGLQADFEVWAIDLLGFGRSAKPQWEYNGDLWRDQLGDFMAQVIQRPTVLAGNSLGGYGALAAAVHCPTLVAGLILLNSAGSFTDPTPPPEPSLSQKIRGQLQRSLVRQPWVSRLIFHWTRRRSTIRRVLKQVYLDHGAITDQLVEDIYRPSCSPGAAEVFASVFKSAAGEKVDVLLGQLQCPLFLLWGEGDPWVDCRSRSAKFHQYYPNLTESFLQAGHCPHDEVPDLVNDSIRSWILSL
ncbi:MAG: alpha/beta fold hydrolase [Oscillatoriales cyanobacterium RM2_1_1]|nr:alpha/beta fold hydrolase [Oscillatoriales cyanobacterium SM2_3_0]NJO44994.1 alpha/beta fold hydrolase [Oscillatoriales cyanobacterium RM2_1_1]